MKKNNLALSFSLVAALATFQISLVLAQTSAAEAIAQGRAALAKQTPEGIAEAISAFNVAVDSEPSNAEANFFKVASLLLQEAGTEEFRKQFSDIGVTIASNLYDPSLLNYTPGHQGILKPAENASTDAHLAYLNSKADFLDDVLEHLEKITDTKFNVTLSSAETSLLQTRIEYADVCLLRAGVHLAKAAIALGNSYNIIGQYRKLYDLFESNKLNPENVMQEFPLLLTFSSTPQSRATAKNSLKAVYDEWKMAYPHLENRANGDRETDQPLGGSNDELNDPVTTETLFSYDASFLQELDTYLAVINSALDSEITLPPIDTYRYFSPPPKLNFAPLVSTIQPPRDYFPTVFDRGYFRPNSWPDPTFGGVLSQGTQSYANDLGVAAQLILIESSASDIPTQPIAPLTAGGGAPSVAGAPAAEKSKKDGKKSVGVANKSTAKKSGGDSKKSSAKKSSAKKSSTKKSSTKKSSTKKSSAKKSSGNSRGSKEKSKKSAARRS